MSTFALTTPRAARLAGRTARVGARTWWRTIKLAFRTPPPRAVARLTRMRMRALRMRTPRGGAPGARAPRARAPRMGELAAVAIAGAGAEYLLDPADGKRRRHELRDRAFAIGRRITRRTTRRARYLEGKVEGVVHEATAMPRPAADDLTLADRVRSQIFRTEHAAKGHVNVGVADGVVYLRGGLDDEQEIERLVRDAAAVPGVLRVENLLHTPQTPAPRGGRA